MTEFSKIVQPRISENVKFIKTGDLNLSVLYIYNAWCGSRSRCWICPPPWNNRKPNPGHEYWTFLKIYDFLTIGEISNKFFFSRFFALLNLDDELIRVKDNKNLCLESLWLIFSKNVADFWAFETLPKFPPFFLAIIVIFNFCWSISHFLL